MNFSSNQDTVSPPSTSTGSLGAEKPDSVGETEEDPEKYYWAPSPVSIVPLLPTDHFCGGTEDKPLDPFDKKYVEVACCPPSPLLEDYDDGDDCSFSWRVNPAFNRQSEPERKRKVPQKTAETRITQIESKVTMASPLPHPRPPSPSHSPSKVGSLQENFANLTHDESPIISEDEEEVTREPANFFCKLCERTYLTQTTYDWHVARHRRCLECGVDLKYVILRKGNISDALIKYCAICASKLKKPFCIYPSPPPPKKKSVKKNVKVEAYEDEDYDEELKGTPRGRPRKMRFTCEKCGKEFTQKKLYEDHILDCQIVKKNDIYVCQLCGKSFDSRIIFNQHLKMHEEEKSNYWCLNCGKGFRYKKYLKSHMADHSTSEYEQFICAVCKKVFGSSASLKNHQRLTALCLQGLP